MNGRADERRKDSIQMNVETPRGERGGVSSDVIMSRRADCIGDTNANTYLQQQLQQRQMSSLQAYEGLRPGLIVHIEGSKRVRDHIEYVIWVCDVKSGVEWRLSRRFREFNEFHELILGIRPSLARIDFPRKRINVTEDQGMCMFFNIIVIIITIIITVLNITTIIIIRYEHLLLLLAIDDLIDERVFLLQKFLRKIASVISVNYNHPTTPKIYLGTILFAFVDSYFHCFHILLILVHIISPLCYDNHTVLM